MPDLAKLKERVDAAQGELAELDAKIPASIAEGADEGKVDRMRRRRRELIETIDDDAEALSILERKAAEAEQKEIKGARKKALAEARASANQYASCAEDVDAALQALERTFDKMRLAGLDLSRALRLAGLSDGGRLGNTLSSGVRWATWLAAPAFAEQAHVPRVEAHRRTRLADSTRRVIPAIPTE